ncbi:MAG: hypothetical protein mread185_000623 [Mycoplasmataceae bacterium]|nr:MAG: hypothetical protein mread185_000623 [Mycoplasmataceae bacterium]
MHKKKNFSLYWWLSKKFCSKIIIWYLFTFLSSFFYYQAICGLKIWGFEGAKFPYFTFFKSISIDSLVQLIWYCFFCFFIGFIITSLICEYYKNYILELSRFLCRKLIIKKSSQKSLSNNQEIRSNFLNEVELFIPLFILTPQKIFSAVVNIVFTLVFLTNFKPDRFSVYFIIFTSLIIALLSFVFYHIQRKINLELNHFRQQENNDLESYLANQSDPREIENIIVSNFHKNRLLLWKKTFSYLPNLIIPGLSILFCFIYSFQKGNNWEMKGFVQAYMISGFIQGIFWKIKEINDNLPDLSKIDIHYKSLQKLLSK